MAASALTPRQLRAAALIGQGQQQREAASEVGVHRGTVKRWMGRKDFREAMDRARAALLDRNPAPQATLEAALTATKASGVPDWQVRVSAAKTLLGREPEGDTAADQVRETTIHLDRIRGAS
jgi:hypothetical protein